jgi:DNA modification methylase
LIIHGDSLEELRALADESIDAVVTDPPYGLGNTSPAQVAECLKAWSAGETWTPKGSGFMGKSWDAWVPPPELWREVFRVLKHGGHALVFAGSRTQDLMSISLRLAGFEVRDTLQWLYGSGFPKGHNVSKAIDVMYGAEPIVIGTEIGFNAPSNGIVNVKGKITKIERKLTVPATEQAKQWEGWNTALKPAYEPCILVRKPLSGTVAQNVLEHGTGALNIDGCRIEASDAQKGRSRHGGGLLQGVSFQLKDSISCMPAGRWPANVLLDEEASLALDEQTQQNTSRFFYCSKASKAEREEGLITDEARANIHPTVKPIALMRYLCRLITPPNGTILDPFTGSGSTLCAAALEGFNPIGIEREAEYVEIARARLAYWSGGVHVQESPLREEQPDTTEPKEVQLSLF